MSIAYVIHSLADLEFVKGTLIRPLPSCGFESWISSASLSEKLDLKPAQTMANCDVILAVISPSASESSLLRDEIKAACLSPTPVIVVQAADLTETDHARLPNEIWLLPLVDLRQPGGRRELAALLPQSTRRAPELSGIATRIEWNEELFSEALRNAISRHEAESLVQRFTNHIEHRPYPYPAGHANADLEFLRNERQFKLMSAYGAAVLQSGTTDEKLRRQFAQALIEQRQFDQALEVLNAITREPEAEAVEVAEAFGLIGRVHKQLYLDQPGTPGSEAKMLKCIDAYRAGFERDSSKLWYGVNLASCIVRANRDGIKGVNVEEAHAIAERLLNQIEQSQASEKLDVWNLATRVEALLVLERYDEAAVALDRYISHPDIHAFEVSSTYRQFDQLLELDRNPRGRLLLERLWEAVQRHRGVDFGEQPLRASARAAGVPSMRSLLIRVTDPDWQPTKVDDLVIESRLGTIISAQGSDASVKQLLGDPNVISVNDSPPGGIHECSVTVPFIRVSDTYQGVSGPFSEKGAKALIAIIDNGIDVLHQAFLDENGDSRIVSIWDQTDAGGTPPPGFKFGSYYDAEAIAGFISSKTTPKKLGRNTNGGGHGTHVASIAAGRKAGAFAGGVAPEARIVVVIADGQSSIGYSKSHVEALAFIDKLATDLELPVVVNVSQGMNAGAHDGRSMLEIAFDEFSSGGRKPGRVIVKSAGNERRKGGHAKVTLGPMSIETLHWKRDPKALVSERLELWWNSADEFEFRLIHPSDEMTDTVANTNQKQSGAFADGTTYAMEFTRRHIDNGDSQLRIKIGEDLGQIAPGTWKLEIQSGNVPEGGDLHAWIERGVGEPTSFANFADEEMTLSIPGTAQTVITVGAVKAALPTQVGVFSSFGPTRDQRKKPEVAAPGIGVSAARSGTDNEVVVMDGTSMAAPHVTGAIALLLSRMADMGQPLPTASQISSALRQKTINYSSHWDRGQGFGILDASALLAAF